MIGFILFSHAVPARSPEQLEDTIDFETSLETIAETVRTGQLEQIDPERYFMLTGSVASIIVFDPNPESFQAVVELVAGGWDGLDSISVSRVYVLLQGPEFAERVPERPRPGAEPGTIEVHERILVIGPFVGTAQLQDEELGVIQAVRIR